MPQVYELEAAEFFWPFFRREVQMRYALLLPVILVASVGSAYASALHDGMRPESDAVSFTIQPPAEDFEALGSAGHAVTARHRADFVHAAGDSSALRSGMRPE